MKSRPIFEIETGTMALTQCRGATNGHSMNLGFFEGRHLMVWDGVGDAPVPTQYYHVRVVGMTPKQGALVVALVDHCDYQGRVYHQDTPQERVIRACARAGISLKREKKEAWLAEVGLTWEDYIACKDAYLD